MKVVFLILVFGIISCGKVNTSHAALSDDASVYGYPYKFTMIKGKLQDKFEEYFKQIGETPKSVKTNVSGDFPSRWEGNLKYSHEYKYAYDKHGAWMDFYGEELKSLEFSVFHFAQEEYSYSKDSAAYMVREMLKLGILSSAEAQCVEKEETVKKCSGRGSHRGATCQNFDAFALHCRLL